MALRFDKCSGFKEGRSVVKANFTYNQIQFVNIVWGSIQSLRSIEAFLFPKGTRETDLNV